MLRMVQAAARGCGGKSCLWHELRAKVSLEAGGKWTSPICGGTARLSHSKALVINVPSFWRRAQLACEILLVLSLCWISYLSSDEGISVFHPCIECLSVKWDANPSSGQFKSHMCTVVATFLWVKSQSTFWHWHSHANWACGASFSGTVIKEGR